MSVGTSIKRERWEDVATGRYMEAAERSAGLAKLGFDGVTAWTQPSGGVAYTYGDVDSALVAADESFRVARAWWFRDRPRGDDRPARTPGTWLAGRMTSFP